MSARIDRSIERITDRKLALERRLKYFISRDIYHAGMN